MTNKQKVFVIIPFKEDFLKLYDELKKEFQGKFEFINAGDLDNQQNILKDIVVGIHDANVIIADLTGLNANVFYELGLAHAMNKKVIIITQNIDELPFDIRSYRVTPYSLVFYKLPELKKELEKLLMGSVDDSVKYGNPVSDFIPDYYRINLQKQDVVLVNTNQDENINNSVDSEEESGFFDYIFYIQDNSKKMTDEITGMENEMKEMNISVALASKDINRIKEENGNIDANFVRTVCRKLSEPVNLFAKKLNQHISNVCNCWDIIENSYLSLMDNKYIKSTQNLQELKESIISLENMQKSIYSSNSSIEELITALHLSIGIERRLNKACTLLISELQKYLSMTNTIASSIDRIISKGEIVIAEFEKDN